MRYESARVWLMQSYFGSKEKVWCWSNLPAFISSSTEFIFMESPSAHVTLVVTFLANANVSCTVHKDEKKIPLTEIPNTCIWYTVYEWIILRLPYNLLQTPLLQVLDRVNIKTENKEVLPSLTLMASAPCNRRYFENHCVVSVQCVTNWKLISRVFFNTMIWPRWCPEREYENIKCST